ncbi:hypothetical protein D9613_001269 [Agrocybe pediades]|uniref:Uncharacterized protein n=1 Tax=Agrocybe pediades TaxID=84607 RepID=A0A8H4VX60_9AGAR|nr:hypothetical protein D9613_001269 [Agrocybe pediades]
MRSVEATGRVGIARFSLAELHGELGTSLRIVGCHSRTRHSTSFTGRGFDELLRLRAVKLEVENEIVRERLMHARTVADNEMVRKKSPVLERQQEKTSTVLEMVFEWFRKCCRTRRSLISRLLDGYPVGGVYRCEDVEESLWTALTNN